MSVLFVTGVYDVYGGEGPSASLIEEFWRRLGVIAPHLPRLQIFGEEEACPLAHLPNVAYARLLRDNIPLHAMLDCSVPASGCGNPAKDTKAYMRLICCKPELAALAAELCAEEGREVPRLVAWIDAGISKVLSSAEEDVLRLVADLSDVAALGAAESHVVVPGCWPWCIRGGEGEYTGAILWRFCGGFFFATPSLMRSFADETTRACARILEVTGAVTWEVNVWAYMEAHLDVPILWSCGDHNSSIFDCARAFEFPAIEGA